jgi:hypothetical protein
MSRESSKDTSRDRYLSTICRVKNASLAKVSQPLTSDAKAKSLCLNWTQNQEIAGQTWVKKTNESALGISRHTLEKSAKYSRYHSMAQSEVIALSLWGRR